MKCHQMIPPSCLLKVFILISTINPTHVPLIHMCLYIYMCVCEWLISYVLELPISMLCPCLYKYYIHTGTSFYSFLVKSRNQFWYSPLTFVSQFSSLYFSLQTHFPEFLLIILCFRFLALISVSLSLLPIGFPSSYTFLPGFLSRNTVTISRWDGLLVQFLMEQ